MDVILFGLDCLSILLYAYVHIPRINCLIDNLEIGGLNVHSVLYT